MKAHTKDTQANMTLQSSLNALLDGNARFVNGQPVNRNLMEQVSDTGGGQYPFATVLSCIDSRIPTEIIFDQGIGDIFNARIAGNFINEDILGSMEFACKLAGSKVIMVLGHTSCGGVKGACDNAELGNLTQMLQKIKPAVDMTKTEPGEARNSSNTTFVNNVARQNVLLAMDDIKAKSAVLKEMYDNNEIDIVGAMYDVKTGMVSMVS